MYRSALCTKTISTATPPCTVPAHKPTPKSLSPSSINLVSYNPNKTMERTNLKLRVAHIITQLELGGAQRNTLYTLSHLAPDRFEPMLICGRGEILDEEAN